MCKANDHINRKGEMQNCTTSPPGQYDSLPLQWWMPSQSCIGQIDKSCDMICIHLVQRYNWLLASGSNTTFMRTVSLWETMQKLNRLVSYSRWLRSILVIHTTFLTHYLKAWTNECHQHFHRNSSRFYPVVTPRSLAFQPPSPQP